MPLGKVLFYIMNQIEKSFSSVLDYRYEIIYTMYRFPARKGCDENEAVERPHGGLAPEGAACMGFSPPFFHVSRAFRGEMLFAARFFW